MTGSTITGAMRSNPLPTTTPNTASKTESVSTATKVAEDSKAVVSKENTFQRIGRALGSLCSSIKGLFATLGNAIAKMVRALNPCKSNNDGVKSKDAETVSGSTTTGKGKDGSGDSTQSKTTVNSTGNIANANQNVEHIVPPEVGKESASETTFKDGILQNPLTPSKSTVTNSQTSKSDVPDSPDLMMHSQLPDQAQLGATKGNVGSNPTEDAIKSDKGAADKGTALQNPALQEAAAKETAPQASAPQASAPLSTNGEGSTGLSNDATQAAVDAKTEGDAETTTVAAADPSAISSNETTAA